MESSKFKLSSILLNGKLWIEYSSDGHIESLIEVSEISTVSVTKGGVGDCMSSPVVGAGRAYYHFSSKFTVEDIKRLMGSTELISIEK
jgi:hypothetical protein